MGQHVTWFLVVTITASSVAVPALVLGLTRLLDR